MTATAPTAGLTAMPRTQKRRSRTGSGWATTLLLAPAALGFAVFYLAPALRSIYFSFTDSTLFNAGGFVGLKNYQRMFSDSWLSNSVVVTLQYTLINIVVQTAVALLLAVVLDRITKSLWLRALLLLPWLVPGVTVGLLWSWMLDSRLGIINQIFGALGLPDQSWLNSTTWAMPTLALINTWRYVGYVALLFFAGLQMIPRNLYEAASIDGAGEVRMFRSITLPLLRPIIGFVLITTTVGSLQVFDIIQVTTNGGPVNATRAFYPFIYQTAFINYDLGYGSAVAVSFMLVIGLLTFFSMRMGRANESEIEGV